MHIGVVIACTLGFFLGSAAAAPSPEAVAHNAHHASVLADNVQRTVVDIRVPDVALVRDDGKQVSLAQELSDSRPVYIDFVYTTCTAICPITSATFAAMQDKLGADSDKVRLMSISIDPEEDTPRRLTAYRHSFGAGPEWRQYTGTLPASVETQRAFGVYAGDKMGHTPVTLFREAPGKPWVRIDGFASPDQLLVEMQRNEDRK
jgi:protein SCO1/2